MIKLKNMLKNWKRRKLTLHGRIKIVKTLGLSKLIYNTSVLEIPDCYSLRKQPSFFAPGPSGVSRDGPTRAGSEEGRLFSQATIVTSKK